MTARLLSITLALAGFVALGEATLKGRTLAHPGSAISEGRTPALSVRNASYDIDARLDPASRTITGRAVLHWTNVAPVSASDLRFHLYWNAWSDTKSTWMRERALAGNTSLHDRPPGDWTSMVIDELGLVGAPGEPSINLTSRLRFIAPDDGNVDDRTVAGVSLDRPVAPGETIGVLIRWRARVPRPFSRTGGVGNYYFIAQWFPKIGVLEPTGWNCHQFHSATEFFADFGVYDVRLTVPRGWVVGATGREQGRQDNADGSTSHHYYEEDVHDFAWTTSPDFVERRARFEHPGLPPVDMRLLLQPEHAGQEARHFDATRAALRYYGEWYGPYPYGHITIVDPAWQSRSGGMEYPTLFTAGTGWLPAEGTTEPEGVTVHEAGHQFWYGIVATNEFEHAWMDEGFNSFSEARVLDVAYPGRHAVERFFGGFVPWIHRDIRLSRASDLNWLHAFRPNAEADAQATPTFRYWPGMAGSTTYFKTALWLHTLERHIGWPTLQRIMSAYFQRWAFKHPAPDDFFAAANEVSGQDLRWFFDQVYRSSNAFDYAVEGFTNESRPKESAVETTVVVRRHGEAIFPVDVRVTFDDNSTVTWRWDGRERWSIFRHVQASRAVSAEIDPNRVLLLDINTTNNSRTLRPRGAEASVKWAAIWMTWLQDLLMTYAFFV